jgi:hypothetical protein
VVVIWAYHDQDPRLGAEMIYHGDKRGAQSLHLLGPPPIPKARGANIRNWDVTLQNVGWGLFLFQRRRAGDCISSFLVIIQYGVGIDSRITDVKNESESTFWIKINY